MYCDAFNRIKKVIIQYHREGSVHTNTTPDDIEMMINEAYHDGDLTSEDCVDLRSELYV